jgi:hypothetical protein
LAKVNDRSKVRTSKAKNKERQIAAILANEKDPTYPTLMIYAHQDDFPMGILTYKNNIAREKYKTKDNLTEQYTNSTRAQYFTLIKETLPDLIGDDDLATSNIVGEIDLLGTKFDPKKKVDNFVPLPYMMAKLLEWNHLQAIPAKYIYLVQINAHDTKDEVVQAKYRQMGFHNIGQLQVESSEGNGAFGTPMIARVNDVQRWVIYQSAKRYMSFIDVDVD